MQVNWLEQTFSEVRGAPDWLSCHESERLAAMRIPKRRHDWQLGRWTAKHAVAAYLGIAPSAPNLALIEIRPALSGAPDVYIEDWCAPVSISLSHRDGRAMCAIASFGISLGCDLEIVEARCDAFVTDYFTSEEQAFIAETGDQARFGLVALLWSAKESVLKALRTGLRLDPRTVEITLDDGWGSVRSVAEGPPPTKLTSWHGFTARCASAQEFRGWWQSADSILRTLVSAPHSVQPLRFEVTQNPRAHEFPQVGL
jgi:4'-phosphopantetheinyl transferase